MLLRRERLSLRGTHQPIDMRIAPNLPDIWSRRSRGVSTVLQSNVDAVIAQVRWAIALLEHFLCAMSSLCTWLAMI